VRKEGVKVNGGAIFSVSSDFLLLVMLAEAVQTRAVLVLAEHCGALRSAHQSTLKVPSTKAKSIH
jgi:hypothetical protein